VVKKNKNSSLTYEEKRVAKALILQQVPQQDIQYLLNFGRRKTINNGRISEISSNLDQEAATGSEVEYFKLKKQHFDPQTGLNVFDGEDERLIRAREAMILAVQSFNSVNLKFKSENFALLSMVAWTYLLLEHHKRNGENICPSGRYLSLKNMLKRTACPLDKETKINLECIILIRNAVTHECIGKSDNDYFGHFQACCLNFEEYLCKLFGEKLTLTQDLSLALQFSKIDIHQARTLDKFKLPETISTLEKLENLAKDFPSSTRIRAYLNIEKVLAPKSFSDFKYTFSGEENGQKAISVSKETDLNIRFPYKPMQVVNKVKSKIQNSFSMYHHTNAWKHFKIRPPKKSSNPEKTNKKYCYYNVVHKSYSYSDDWIDFIISKYDDIIQLKR